MVEDLSFSRLEKHHINRDVQLKKLNSTTLFQNIYDLFSNTESNYDIIFAMIQICKKLLRDYKKRE